MLRKKKQSTDAPLRDANGASISFGGLLVRGLSSLFLGRRHVVLLLLGVIALELTVLGVGLFRRLEMAYQQSLDVSRAQLAVIEARELEGEPLPHGSAGIAATDSETDPDAAPPLRARDVDTILAQEGGEDVVPAHEENSSENGAESAVETAAAEAADTPATAQLSQDDREELDLLIRKGVTAMVAGDMRLCILSLEEARTLAPEHPALLYYYGLAYDKLLNPEKARTFYTKVFQMRDAAGSYFKRASRRLSFGFEQPSAMRGKLSFGPHHVNHTDDPETGEKVDILLPVLLAPGEEVRPDDIYITIQFFDLVNGRKIEFSRLATPKLSWQNEKPDWREWEENLLVSYAVPALTQEELDAYGDLKYYGFTAKLYYKGEPLDCISSPSALILQEQRLNSRRRTPRNGLLPDDGLDNSYEEAQPVSDFLEQLAQPES
ncbi:MAG: hypothetical protein MJ051_07015 [Akkermansia sp.]|nr:hypothetical protein [Akkermansia sp.]